MTTTIVGLVIDDKFDFSKYKENMDSEIKNILQRPQNDFLPFDILDTEKSKEDDQIALRVKQRKMKYAEIWQGTIGNYDGFVNLKIGHETGLDILSKERKLAIELKNRTNTDNYSSKKTNRDKLAKFKKENPEYRCIYGCINTKTEKEFLKGSIKKNTHNGVEIEEVVGYQLLELIFGERIEEMIEFVQNTIDKYT